MSDARQRILDRLRANRPQSVQPPSSYEKILNWDNTQRVAAFVERMSAVRGEVHRLQRDEWPTWLAGMLSERGLTRGLIGTSPVAEQFAAVADEHLSLTRFTQPIEAWKTGLFNDIDFSLTGARSGLAESGSLVLWPDAQEPRLMSLVPPLHIAILETQRLFENFAAMLASERWADGAMPTNALLISGPSKTADIEQTLAYGIHGPKQLITLLID